MIFTIFGALFLHFIYASFDYHKPNIRLKNILTPYTDFFRTQFHLSKKVRNNWPRRLACAMRAPCVAWPLLSPLLSLSLLLFFFLRLLLLTHFGETPMCEIIGPGGLRAPCVLACAMRIIIIIQTLSIQQRIQHWICRLIAVMGTTPLLPPLKCAGAVPHRDPVKSDHFFKFFSQTNYFPEVIN